MATPADNNKSFFYSVWGIVQNQWDVAVKQRWQQIQYVNSVLDQLGGT